MSKIGFVMVMNGFFMAVALGGHGILGGKSEGLWFAKNRRETRCHTWLFLPALFIAAFVTAQPTMGDRFGGLCFGLCFVSFSFLSACVRLSLQMMIMTVKILRMKNATRKRVVLLAISVLLVHIARPLGTSERIYCTFI